METIDIALHLASGKEVRTQIEVPADLEDNEVDELIHRSLAGSSKWQQLGDVHFYTGAVQALEVL